MIAKQDQADDGAIQVRLAQPSDLKSLETVVARCFHPGNDYIKAALPDTQGMQKWWRDVFAEEIENPFAHPIIALDTTTNEVVGFSCLRHVQPSVPSHEPLGGFWTKHPWTPEHDESKWRFIIDCLIHWEQVMFGHGEDYMHMELMGVESAYQGQGIGKRMVQKACQIVDENHCAMFLQSGGAKDYYNGKLDMGFITLEKPEWGGYKAFLSVRPVKT